MCFLKCICAYMYYRSELDDYYIKLVAYLGFYFGEEGGL